MCIQMIDFIPWPSCEEDISIWVLYKIYPTVCGILSCLAKGQNIPCKGEGAEILSDQSVNLCLLGLSCGCVCVARAMLHMPFQ